MKSVTVVCFLTALVFAAGEEQYTNRFDGLNVQQVLNNQRLLNSYINCTLDKGKCTAEGRELKSHIKEALENQCAKCTDVQRTWTRKVIAHLINNESALWRKLVEKYDPQRKYTVRYEKELRSIQA